MERPVKLVVLVLATYASPYPALIKTIRKTWATTLVPGVEMILYYGGNTRVDDGDVLVLPVPDDLPHAGLKTIACFDYLLEHRHFDAVFRTNCSSYVDAANLLSYAATIDDLRNFYGGMRGMLGSMPFASGSGYILGRKLVELVASHRGAWQHKLPDDQALAAILAEQGIEPSETKRQDFDEVPRREDVDVTQFHIRCRTDSFRRRRDRKIMRTVHGAFVAARAG